MKDSNINNEKTKPLRPMTALVNKTSKVSLIQSPKIGTNRFRKKNLTIQTQNITNGIQIPKLFSLLDVNDTKTNNRGTDLPMQFKRYSKEELKCIIEGKKLKKEENTMTKKKKFDTLPARPRSSKPSIRKNIITFKKDRNLPTNFADYCDLIHNPSLMYEEFAKSKFYNPKLFNINIEEIKSKVRNSDIFCLKQGINSERNIIKQSNKYWQSDIFNLKDQNDPYEIEKSGEKYLLSQNILNKYTNSNESNSAWIDKKSLIIKTKNYPSTQYNLVVPNIKHLCKTQQNDPQPRNRTKVFSEFIDLTRVASPNLNPSYQDFYNQNQYAFRKVRGMCEEYANTFQSIKAISTTLFEKKKD